jgi:hypothetical protein
MVPTRYLPRIVPLVLVAGIGLLINAAVQAASPSLTLITPRGVQKGTEAVLTFHGARLGDTQEVLIYYPGIQVTKLEVVNDNQVKATVQVAADCRLGEHAFRLRTASGISELQTLYVGALPVVQEKEPNSDFASPQKIELNVTVEGVADNEDVDYFAVDCKKGQRLSVEVEAMRLGTTLFDPYVAILDSRRFELATSDDAPLLGQDAAASVIVPEDGTYVIQVRETSYGGNGNCRYRLHVGTFPRPTGIFPAGGKLGEEVEVTFLGDPAGEIKQKVKLPEVLPGDCGVGNFGLFAEDQGGIAPSANLFRLSAYGNVLEVEPNDNHDQATPGQLPLAFNGVLSRPGDVDYFRFKASKGQTYDVHCYARRLRSALDPVMALYHLGGGAIASNDDSGGPDSYFRITFPEDKEYVIAVWDHLGNGGPGYHYRIEFTPVTPTLILTIPKVDIFGYSQERQTIPIPRGNRYACLMTARRWDYGGPWSVSAEDLPPGVTVHCGTAPAGVDGMPVVFEAAADAPLGGRLSRFRPRHDDPNVAIGGGFLQSVILVGVGNVGVFWQHVVDRAAVAVTHEVPFKIDLLEPKVPLVQNGGMNLKVLVERRGDFKAPITLQMLFNPPGIGSAASVTIPEGQNEAVYPINASGGAAVGKWKIAVIGTANLPTGPVWVSSQLVTLEVAPPFLQLALDRTAVEQGQSTELLCRVTPVTPFEGTAKVILSGLPHLVTAPEVEITKDTKEFVFKIQTDKSSPAGNHQNIFCQVLVPVNGEVVLHNLGSTALRIDPPPPPKPAATAAAPAPPPPPPPAAAPARPLSRLEKLRLEQAERQKAAQQRKPEAKEPGG